MISGTDVEGRDKMGLLDDNVTDSIRKELSVIAKNIKLIVFSRGTGCVSCKDAVLLAEEIASLSDKISIEKYDFIKDKSKTEQYQIDRVPAIAVVAGKDFGIRFYGFPNGYEVSSLVDAIKLVSSGESGLTLKTKEMAAKITKNIIIDIFVTTACPYCSAAVKLANRFAVESDLIVSRTIIADEFPDLVSKYNIFSVPKIVINETVEFEGAVREDEFFENILKA